MKKLILAALLIAVCVVWAGETHPRQGGRNEYRIHVRDVDIHTTAEIVSSDTGFTNLSTDDTVGVEFAAKGHFDSLAVGNAGSAAANLRVVYALSSTADASTNNNFLQDNGQGASAYNSAVFSNGVSPTSDYLIRYEDSDFNLGTNGFTVTAWAKGLSPGNPGIGTIQTVFSVFQTPDQIDLGFNSSGQPRLYITDDGHVTGDSVTVATDYYDSTFHHIVARREGVSWTLQVDDGTKSSTTIDKAAAALTPDTLLILADRVQSGASGTVGARQFRGMVDHFIFIEDSTTYDSELTTYEYRRGSEADSAGGSAASTADSAIVFVQGIGTDSVYARTLIDTVGLGSRRVGTKDWHAFETAWLDSEEVLPIIVYSSGVSPRSALLDSIPAGRLDYDIAQVFFDAKQGLRTIDRVTFTHESPTDTSLWELRMYPSLEDSRDMSDGYYIIANARLHANEQSFTETLNMEVPPSSMAAVFSTAASGSVRRVTGSVTLIGKRR